jgi:hypothetical protein
MNIPKRNCKKMLSTYSLSPPTKVTHITGNFLLCLSDKLPNGTKLEPTHFEKIWLALRYIKSTNSTKGYRLAEGDVLKLGRMKYRVREIKASNGLKPTGTVNLSDLLLGKSVALEDNEEDEEEDSDEQPKEDGLTPCRICLSDSHDLVNPLICPCKCDGTMKYIHLKCLQHWMRSRLGTRSSENSVSLSWKTLNCELCKMPFPNSLVMNGNVIELIDIPKPPCQYIILETLKRDKNSNRGLHVLSLYNKNTLKIGRGHDSDFRISDISVSRFHATVKYNNGHFYLEDHSSKFGTLIQIKRPIALDATNPLTIQSGRTLVTFTIKRPFTLIPACFRPNSSGFDVYNTTSNPGEVLILPFNNGIPLSVSSSEELMNRAGMHPLRKPPESYKLQTNLMYNHSQLGLNSSCEEDEEEQPEVPDQMDLNSLLPQRLDSMHSEGAETPVRENVGNERLNHTISYNESG